MLHQFGIIIIIIMHLWFFILAVPLLPNPLLEINTSHNNIITLTWSPPFLWPGRAIRYFNVSFTNKGDDSVTYHRINNSFGNRVFSVMETIPEEPLMCTEIIVNISAISNYSFSTVKQTLQIFSVTDNILPLRKQISKLLLLLLWIFVVL